MPALSPSPPLQLRPLFTLYDANPFPDTPTPTPAATSSPPLTSFLPPTSSSAPSLPPSNILRSLSPSLLNTTRFSSLALPSLTLPSLTLPISSPTKPPPPALSSPPTPPFPTPLASLHFTTEDTHTPHHRSLSILNPSSRAIHLRLDPSECRLLEEKGFSVEHDGQHRLTLAKGEGQVGVTFTPSRGLQPGRVEHQLQLHHADNTASTIVIHLTATVLAASSPPSSSSSASSQPQPSHAAPPPHPRAPRAKSQSPSPPTFRSLSQWLSTAAQSARSSLTRPDAGEEAHPHHHPPRPIRSYSISQPGSTVGSPGGRVVGVREAVRAVKVARSPVGVAGRRSSEPHCYTLQQAMLFEPRGEEGGGGGGEWEGSLTSPGWGQRRPHARSLSDSLHSGEEQ